MVKQGKIIFLMTFLALVIQSPFLLLDKPDELMFLPLILLLGGGTAYLLGRNKNSEDDTFQVNIFLIAFSLRLLVGFLFYGWELGKLFGDEDAAGYYGGWIAANNWYQNGFEGFFDDIYQVLFVNQNIGQMIIWGIPMFFAGGASRLIASCINSYAGALLVIVVYKISKKVFDSKTARVTAILITFWTSFLLFSASTSKEMLVILFEWTLLYLAIRNPKGLAFNDTLTSIPVFIALYVTRFYALYMIVAAYLFRIIISNRKTFWRNAVLGFFILGSVFVLLNASGVIKRDFDRLDKQNQIIGSWRSSLADSTGSGVNVYKDFDESSIAIPVATIYFFLAPFPWEFMSGGLRSSFAVLENFILIVIFIVGFPGIRELFKKKLFEMSPILVFCIMYSGFHIWGLSNVGLAWRHRQTIMPLFFILTAYSLANIFGRRKVTKVI
jgi:hypothetical protein